MIDPEILHIRVKDRVLKSVKSEEVEDWINDPENDYIYKDKEHKVQCMKDAMKAFESREMFEKCVICKEVIEKLEHEGGN